MRSRFSLLLGLFALPLPAQEGPPSRPKARADRTVLESITSESTDPAPSPLESALVLLAVIADGSTLREGPHRMEAKTLLTRLRDGQLDTGRWASGDATARALVDQVWCAYAMQAIASASKYQAIERFVKLSLAATVQTLPEAKSTDVAFVVPLALLAESSKSTEVLDWLRQWWKAQPKVQVGDLLPALAARMLVAEVLELPAAKELAAECASRFTDAMRTGRTRFDEVTLLALGWCHLSTNRLVPAGIDADQLAAQLRAPAESTRQNGPERGTVEPRGPWATESGRASTTAMAWILESLGVRSSRLARR